MITENGIVPIKGGQYKLLDDSQIKDLHNATMDVLGQVGIKLMHNEALDLMKGVGCKVDYDKQIVKISENVLMKYVKMAPSEICLYGRDPKYDVHIDNSDNVYSLGGAGALNYIDLDGQRKLSTMKALEDFTRLEDTLENLDIVHFLLTPQDIEQRRHEMLLFAHMLKNNTRNFYTLLGGRRKGLEFQLEMAAVCSDGIENVCKRPFFVAGLCIESPLKQRRGFVEELWACGDYGIPAFVEADAIAGGTTPFTISGCAVEINANVLSAVALAQMKNPGAPCIYSSSSGILDMRSLDFAGSAPESTLLHMVSTQLAHHYGLPYYGANTPDSKVPDAQMGYEAMQHIMALAMAGCNIIHVSIGNLEMMKLASFAACLISNEIFGAVYRLLQGVDCSREAIGVDAFIESGHDAKFLETMHSVKYVRSRERWEPKLTDRNSWTTWMERTGGKDMAQRANARAKKILAEHHPEYVTESQRKEIDKIAAAAQRWFIENWKEEEVH
ncbi:MAG: trimethylamine methyltransferase family protein [Planctomycetota bacterium]|nr:trimethylamine methyltransferase family protein [Planctomycetota bacterium]